MSIQEQPICYDTPEKTSPSSIVINRGDEKYDPFSAYDDEHENEQSTDTNHQKQESIRINNGDATPPVIDNTNASSSSDKSSSSHRNEQELRRKSKSPQEHHPKHSDRRSRSPYHQNHYSSDRKRLRPSSPDASIPTTTTTVNNNESSNSEIISSSKQKQSYRNDNRKKSKHHSKNRSSSISSSSKSPPSPITSNNNNNKKSSDSKEEKSIRSSDNNSTRHSSKRDDYRSHRYNSSRNYYSHSSSSSSKHSPRDYPSSTHQPNIDRRSSNPSRLPSVIVTSDGNTSLHSNESKVNETSTDDRSRIINRLKNVNDTNTPTNLPITNSNKTSSSGSTAFNTNGGSQRSRNNLIQIVTTEATPVSTQVPPVRLSSPQVKPEPIKPPSVPSKIESATNPTDSSKTTASKTTASKTNGGTADDMLMEEMLLEEEQEQSPVKSIDLDSLTIPETSIKKTDTKEEPIKIITTTTVSTPPITTVTTTTTLITTSAASLTPSPTKKLYTLYKVPHTNHVTPPLSSRHKKQIKKEPFITQSDLTIPNKSAADDNSQRTSLDERISDLLGVPPTSSTEQQLDTRPNPSTQIITTTSTPSDKSTESPQDITSLISTMIKKGHDHAPLTRKLSINDERRSTTSKHYTSEWLATQKPEEAPTGLLEELTALPSLVTLPTLISSQVATNNTKPSISNSGEVMMLGKLSEAMSKLIHKQGDTNVPPVAEGEDAVPISAKHLERLERRKQREKRQSEIAAIAKEALKPAFRKHDITKDEYKEIMKKVVTKATQANEVDRIRIGKMIDAYVEKYRSIRQHYTSKTSTTSNGTKS